MNPRTSLLYLALLMPLQVSAATLIGKVVAVSAGDTITILIGNAPQHIRLMGIDAPEHEQSYGEASRRSLSELLAGKQVRVDYEQRDSGGRIVGVAWLRSPYSPCEAAPCPKTLDAGMYQLTVGMAWWYRQHADAQTPQRRGQYEFAEFEARARRAGLWQEADAVAPWAWRRQNRAPQK